MPFVSAYFENVPACDVASELCAQVFGPTWVVGGGAPPQHGQFFVIQVMIILFYVVELCAQGCGRPCSLLFCVMMLCASCSREW